MSCDEESVLDSLNDLRFLEGVEGEAGGDIIAIGLMQG